MFRAIQTLENLNPNRLTMNQSLRVFTTRKRYLVLSEGGGFHLTNNPKRLVMEKYRLEEAYDIEIYELFRS